MAEVVSLAVRSGCRRGATSSSQAAAGPTSATCAVPERRMTVVLLHGWARDRRSQLEHLLRRAR